MAESNGMCKDDNKYYCQPTQIYISYGVIGYLGRYQQTEYVQK